MENDIQQLEVENNVAQQKIGISRKKKEKYMKQIELTTKAAEEKEKQY